MTTEHDLNELRARIDDVDKRILDLVRERLDLCVRVAEHKREQDLPMMSPHRLDAVYERAARYADEHGLNKEFLRDVMELLTHETCRVEDDVIGGAERSPLGGNAVRIDHVAIAVRDLETAIAHFRDGFGFEMLERRQVSGAVSGMNSATLRAGGVTFVLCQGDTPESNVSRYVEHYGPGVQHVALAVRRQGDVLDDLRDRGADLLTGIINAPGLDQSFTTRDANSGIQVEFVTRSDNNGFEDSNVQELFEAMERENVY